MVLFPPSFSFTHQASNLEKQGQIFGEKLTEMLKVRSKSTNKLVTEIDDFVNSLAHKIVQFLELIFSVGPVGLEPTTARI